MTVAHLGVVVVLVVTDLVEVGVVVTLPHCSVHPQAPMTFSLEPLYRLLAL